MIGTAAAAAAVTPTAAPNCLRVIAIAASQRRVSVGHQLLELRGEPRAGDRRVGQRAALVVPVAGVAAVVRVAHLVEALAARVARAGRDQRAGAVRLARGLHPHVRVAPGGRGGLGTLAEAGAALVAPVTGVAAPVDA